jgi:hypothetical protein
MKKIFFIGFLLAPAFAFAQTGTSTVATTTSATSSQATCMQAALEKRENSLITAHDVFNTAVKTSLTNRLNALKDSWNQTDKKVRIEKRQAAYKAFRTDMQTAHTNIRSTKNASWKTFQTDAKNCGVKATGETPTAFPTMNVSL